MTTWCEHIKMAEDNRFYWEWNRGRYFNIDAWVQCPECRKERPKEPEKLAKIIQDKCKEKGWPYIQATPCHYKQVASTALDVVMGEIDKHWDEEMKNSQWTGRERDIVDGLKARLEALR